MTLQGLNVVKGLALAYRMPGNTPLSDKQA